MSEELQHVRAEVSQRMDEIRRLFRPGALITALVRNPGDERELGARDFVLTNDDLMQAAQALERPLLQSTPSL